MDMKLIEWLVFNENSESRIYLLYFNDKGALECEEYEPDDPIPAKQLYMEVMDIKAEEGGIEIWLK